MNSWGTVWGDQGFIWMKYDDFARYCFEDFEMTIEDTKAKTLSGKLKITLSAGDEMKAYYKDGYFEVVEPYHSGTLFRLFITNHEPAYVYAFGSDLSNNNYRIFPNKEGISAYLGYKGNNIAIPNEDYYLQMDNTTGIDYFCVLYSSERLDIESVMKQVQNSTGSFQERVQKVLGDKMLSSRDVNYFVNEGIGFKGVSENKTIVPVIIAINHI